MRITFSQIILISFILYGCYKNDNVTMKVLNTKPIICNSNDSSFNLQFEIENSSDKNFIFYSFDSIISIGQKDDTSICNAPTEAGIWVNYYDKNQKLCQIKMYSNNTVEELQKLIQIFNIQKIYLTSHDQYPEPMILIKKTKRYFNKNISLKKTGRLNSEPIPLPSYFNIVYFSGNDLSGYVNEEFLQSLSKSNNAEVFYGCIRTELLPIEFK
jgi:hypothetical protein